MPRERKPKKATTNRHRGRPKAHASDPQVIETTGYEVQAGEPKSFTAWEASLTPTEKLVEQICEYMMGGQWLGGASTLEVARKNNLSPETVRRYAAEANRLLRDRLRQDPELRGDAREDILQNFRVIRALAIQQKDAGSLGVALNATRALGFYLGLEPSRQADVHVDLAAADYAEWTTEEIEAYARSGKKPRRALRAVARMLVEGEINGAELNGNGHADDDDDPDGPAH